MSNIVKLNVGGTRYETTAMTLMRFGDSMLARMIQQPNEMQKISRGEELFIDRDGANFGYLLSYLRDGDDMIIPQEKISRERLIADAGFYQVPGLVGLIKAASALKVGDMVKLETSDEARAYFDSVISKEENYDQFGYYGPTNFDDSFSSNFKKCRDKKIPLKYECLIGKISSMDGQCATVTVARACLMAVLSATLGIKENSVYEIHIPLAYLKLSTQ